MERSTETQETSTPGQENSAFQFTGSTAQPANPTAQSAGPIFNFRAPHQLTALNTQPSNATGEQQNTTAQPAPRQPATATPNTQPANATRGQDNPERAGEGNRYTREQFIMYGLTHLQEQYSDLLLEQGEQDRETQLEAIRERAREARIMQDSQHRHELAMLREEHQHKREMERLRRANDERLAEYNFFSYMGVLIMVIIVRFFWVKMTGWVLVEGAEL